MNRDNWFPTLLAFNVAWQSIVTAFASSLPAENFALAALIVGPSFLSLAVYHQALHRTEHSLTSRDVDSVYYGGFLITLLVLIASVYELSSSSNSTKLLPLIASKFALGLLVTGYGLFARITLQKRLIDEESLQDNLNRYADSIAILNDRIAESANLLSTRLVDVLEEAKASGRESTKEIVTVITNDLGPASEQLKQTISKINRSFGRFEESKFQDLTEASNRLTKELEELHRVVNPLRNELDASVSAHQQLNSAILALERLADAGKIRLYQFSEAAAASGVALDSLANTINVSSEPIAEVRALGENLKAAFSSINQASDDLSRQLNNSVNSIRAFVGAVDVAALRRFADEISRSAEGSAQLSEQMANSVNKLSELVDSGNGALANNVRVLNITSQSMSQTSKSLSDAMVKMATAIRDAADSAMRL